MAALTWEGFDDQRPVGELGITPTGAKLTNAAGGRGGGRRLQVLGDEASLANQHQRGYFADLSEPGSTLWAGGWFEWNASWSAGPAMRAFAIYIGGTARVAFGPIGTQDPANFRLWWNPNMNDRPIASPSFTSTNTPFTRGAGQHVAVEVERRASEGDLRIYIDGSEVAEFLGRAELAESHGDFTGVLFQVIGANNTVDASGIGWWDDCWVATHNVGDARVVTLVPESQGFHDDGTPSTGSDNFAVVNDAPPDDGTYVTLGGDGDRDSYVYTDADLATEGRVAVLGVRFQHRAEGAGTVAPFVRAGGADHDLDPLAVPGSGVEQLDTYAIENPATSAPWSFADVDGGEFGVRFNA